MAAFTEYHTYPLEEGLRLEERKGERTYKARMHWEGKTKYTNTETADIDLATRRARAWFFREKAKHIPGAVGTLSMEDAFKNFYRDLEKESKREFYTAKWNAIRDHFRDRDVTMVDTPFLKELWRTRKAEGVKPNTQAKDFICIRRILKTAVDDGKLAALPRFPDVPGANKPNPQMWLTHEQWNEVLREAEARVNDASDEAGSHRYTRQDLVDFMKLQVATCMRVGELRILQVGDVLVQKSHKRTMNGKPVDPIILQHLKHSKQPVKFDPVEYLEITVRPIPGSKRGQRTAYSRRTFSAVDVFQDRVKRLGLKPQDKLFNGTYTCREGFKELLKFCGLYLDDEGRKRNLKALRCTGFMFWILENPTVNLKLLADAGGTSVMMLDKYYLKPLNAKMNKDELVG